jgi:hypothetical protein
MRLLKAFGLPSLLLVLVVLTHYSYDLIASFYANQLAAAKAWHSVLRAGEGTLLYLVVWSLVPLKPTAVRYGAAVACAWGVFESAQIAVCRLQYPMDRPPPDTALYTGLCDTATGLPIYMLTVFIVLCIAVLRKRRDGSSA